MKFYKYYETTEEYEIDAPNIGAGEHYTIYIADTKTSLINSKYIKDLYFVYENPADLDSIKIINDWSNVISAVCLNNNQQIDTTGSNYEIDTSSITGDIKIWFEFNPEVLSLYNTFNNIHYLKEVHGQVFKGLNNLRDVTQLFNNCTNLSYISPDLFKDINLSNANGCFQNCSSLSNIPENLFSYSSGLVNVENCFYNCAALTSIPNNLFANNKGICRFDNCFNGCTNLTGNTPKGTDGIELWDRAGTEGYPAITLITGTDCFKGCTKLVEYDLSVENPIPVEWGGQEQIVGITERTPGWIYILDQSSLPISSPYTLYLELEDGSPGYEIPLTRKDNALFADLSSYIEGKPDDMGVRQIQVTIGSSATSFVQCTMDVSIGGSTQTRSLMPLSIIRYVGLYMCMYPYTGIGGGFSLQNLDCLVVGSPTDPIAQLGVTNWFPIRQQIIDKCNTLWDNMVSQTIVLMTPGLDKQYAPTQLVITNGQDFDITNEAKYGVQVSYNGLTKNFGGFNSMFPPGANFSLQTNLISQFTWQEVEPANTEIESSLKLYAGVRVRLGNMVNSYETVIMRHPELL